VSTLETLIKIHDAVFFPKRLLVSLAAFFLAFSVWAIAPVAQAYDNPDLLPNTQTPVIDLANFLPALQEEALIKDLETFEAETGWKLRVLTQYDRTPGRAVKNFWGLNDKSVLLIADARGGNLLGFNVGDDLYQVPPSHILGGVADTLRQPLLCPGEW
jgi:hypothetical protein